MTKGAETVAEQLVRTTQPAPITKPDAPQAMTLPGQGQLDVSGFDQLAIGEHVLELNNVTIGKIVVSADKISVLVDKQDDAITLCGSPLAKSIDIKVPGELKLHSALSTKDIAVSAGQLHVNHTLSSESTIQLNAADKVTLNQEVRAQTLLINADKIENHNKVAANIAKIKASNEIHNKGKLIGIKKLHLRAPKVIDEGVMIGLHKLSMKGNTWQMNESSKVQCPGLFKFKGNELSVITPS